MRRHIFLTGEKGVGKSTVVDRVVAALGVTVSGFYTFFDEGRESPDRRLLVCGARGGRSIEGSRVLVSFGNGFMGEIDKSGFDVYAAGLIPPPEDAGLIVMDECGGFESDCLIFRAAVMDALSGSVPVLGVLREGTGTWRDGIRSHPAVRLLTVTRENRGALAAGVTSALAMQGV